MVVLKWCCLCADRKPEGQVSVNLLVQDGGIFITNNQVYFCDECYRKSEFAYIDPDGSIKFHFAEPIDIPKKSD